MTTVVHRRLTIHPGTDCRTARIPVALLLSTNAGAIATYQSNQGFSNGTTEILIALTPLGERSFRRAKLDDCREGAL